MIHKFIHNVFSSELTGETQHEQKVRVLNTLLVQIFLVLPVAAIAIPFLAQEKVGSFILLIFLMISLLVVKIILNRGSF